MASVPETKVSMAGVSRRANEAELITAIRQAAEAATDFSWLSRGDSILIKPVVNCIFLKKRVGNHFLRMALHQVQIGNLEL